jgi:hypothetical protein
MEDVNGSYIVRPLGIAEENIQRDWSKGKSST